MAEGKPVLAVDVDEVLAGFLPALVAFHNDRYGTSLQPGDFFSYQFHEVWGGSPEHSKAKMSLFFESSYFYDIAPIEGAREHLLLLKRHFSLHIVTSRSFSVEAATKTWVDRHFPDVFTAIHFGNHYGSAGEVRSKPKMCLDIGAGLLIDDSALYAAQCAEAGIYVVLFGNYAWNRVLEDHSSQSRLVRRATDWAQAYRVVAEVVREDRDRWKLTCIEG